MAERYIELAEEEKYKSRKYKRRSEKRKALIDFNKKYKDNVKPLSRKDEYTVFYMKDGKQDKTYEYTLNATKLHGKPGEFKDILNELKEKYNCKIEILEIVTK